MTTLNLANAPMPTAPTHDPAVPDRVPVTIETVGAAIADRFPEKGEARALLTALNDPEAQGQDILAQLGTLRRKRHWQPPISTLNTVLARTLPPLVKGEAASLAARLVADDNYTPTLQDMETTLASMREAVRFPLSAETIAHELTKARLSPHTGEVPAVIEMLRAQGNSEPNGREIRDALEQIRKHAKDEAAAEFKRTKDQIELLVPDAAVSDHEIAPLARSFGGRPFNENGLRRAIRDLRRPTWTEAVQIHAASNPTQPWLWQDIDQTVNTITTLNPSNKDLIDRFQACVAQRISDEAQRDAGAALKTAVRALRGRNIHVSLDLFSHLTEIVRNLGNLTPAAIVAARTSAFADRPKDPEKQSSSADPRRHSPEWLATLVDQKALKRLLSATDEEIATWIRLRFIPVAFQPSNRRWSGPSSPLFDPVVIRRLATEIPAWRDLHLDPSPGKDGGHVHSTQRRLQIEAIRACAGMDKYAGHFVTARAMRREIRLITGPTNSGKTFRALQRLATAETGAILAPLRLLALEFQEALTALGIPTSLVTGEEMLLTEHANHVAATVEMADLARVVDVAVIDECHLLYDRDRGGAWTAAIMGIPAREVIVIGAPECIPIVRRIAALCGDEIVEEISLERMTPLQIDHRPVEIGAIEPGDAVVAFSRRAVFDLRERIVATRHLSVAVVYGALGPEVRRAEAERFRNGEADVLVATDAIGMGLNLPIKRIIFDAIEKFDGMRERELTGQEVKQIAGRAGRYGKFEIGTAASMGGRRDAARLAQLWNAPFTPPNDLRPRVLPDRAIIRAVAQEVGTDSLTLTLDRIRASVLRSDDPNYRLGDLSLQSDIAAAIDQINLDLLDRWVYAMAPVDEKNAGVETLAVWASLHAAGKTVHLPEIATAIARDPTESGLEQVEAGYKRLITWLWLSRHFPAVYTDANSARQHRREINDWIEQALRNKAIARTCRDCGNRLNMGHRHQVCEVCLGSQSRRRRRT